MSIDHVKSEKNSKIMEFKERGRESGYYRRFTPHFVPTDGDDVNLVKNIMTVVVQEKIHIYNIIISKSVHI